MAGVRHVEADGRLVCNNDGILSFLGFAYSGRRPAELSLASAGSSCVTNCAGCKNGYDYDKTELPAAVMETRQSFVSSISLRLLTSAAVITMRELLEQT